MSPDKGSSAPTNFTINLSRDGPTGKEIEDRIKGAFNNLGFKWFTDYFIERRKDAVILSIYNKEMEQHIPETLLEEYIK